MAEIFKFRSLTLNVSGPQLGFFDVINTGVVGAGNKIYVKRITVFTDTSFNVAYFLRVATARLDLITQGIRVRKEYGGDIILEPGQQLGVEILLWPGGPIQIFTMRADFIHRINEPV